VTPPSRPLHRRYTIHRDGDLLVEDLDEEGRPIDPEPVGPEDRLPVEVIVRAGSDAQDVKTQLLELMELAYGMESEGPPEPPDPTKFKHDRG
jgi:hypothetical protein